MVASQYFAPASDANAEPAPTTPGRVGVVDIGSNTVRLVVYDTPTRLPIPIFNEKAQCALGADMGKTGRLNEKGATVALATLARFARLVQAMGVARLEIVATAAVRDASDGTDFAAEAERVCGEPVHVLSGAEEARLAAVGLLNGVPSADGVLGDLGGGSLDLVGLDDGQIGTFATLSLGHLRLKDDSGGDRTEARRLVDAGLKKIDWLDGIQGRSFYAVGGSWRALARILIEQTHHPLHVLDNFTIGFFDALRLTNLIGGLGQETLEQLSGITSRRVETLPYAAIALSAIIEAARPAKVVFSGFGMREGQMLELLPPDLRHQDPLISACETHAERTGRFAMHGQEILDWMSPLFADETEAQRRLRLAACLLSDIGWSEHPDYRALHAFERVLRIPYAGLTHDGRGLLAVAVFVRYKGNSDDPLVTSIHDFLDDDGFTRARTIGLALRLAHTLSGGAPGFLSLSPLEVGKERLTLAVPDPVFLSEAVERRFNALARHLGLKGKFS
ncbi:MAG: Ppx/GppA family phosphatase [Rhodospirillales bacterium]|nr:Ppx/GppA family phosphatase [Rhodospirillales bacterium]